LLVFHRLPVRVQKSAQCLDMITKGQSISDVLDEP